MSLSINWASKVITIPQNYLTHVEGDIYKLDVNQFRLDLKSLEDSEEGMTFPDTHQHNTEVSVGGVTLGRVVEIINGYTITFEEGMYMVNLFGANNNISDVTNLNYVSVRSANSAGLIVSGSGVTEQDKEDITSGVWENESGTQITDNLSIVKKIMTSRWRIDKNESLMYIYEGTDSIALLTLELLDENGERVDFSDPNAVVYEKRPI